MFVIVSRTNVSSCLNCLWLYQVWIWGYERAAKCRWVVEVIPSRVTGRLGPLNCEFQSLPVQRIRLCIYVAREDVVPLVVRRVRFREGGHLLCAVEGCPLLLLDAARVVVVVHHVRLIKL